MVASRPNEVRSERHEFHAVFPARLSHDLLYIRISLRAGHDQRLVYGIQKVPAQHIHVHDGRQRGGVEIAALRERERSEQPLFLAIKRRKANASPWRCLGKALCKFQERGHTGRIVACPQFAVPQMIVVRAYQHDLFAQHGIRTGKYSDDIRAQVHALLETARGTKGA